MKFHLSGIAFNHIVAFRDGDIIIYLFIYYKHNVKYGIFQIVSRYELLATVNVIQLYQDFFIVGLKSYLLISFSWFKINRLFF